MSASVTSPIRSATQSAPPSGIDPKGHARRSRIGLRGKLIFSYLVVGLTATLLGLLVTRLVRQRSTENATLRDADVELAVAVLATTSSAFEEGFGYLATGKELERVGFLNRMAEVRTPLDALDSARSNPRQREAILRLRRDLPRALEAARAVFSARANRRDPLPTSIDAYEEGMDGLVRDARDLLSVTSQAEHDEDAQWDRLSDRAGLMSGVFATLLSVLLGAFLGRHITRPLLRLRDAALALGRGGIEVFEVEGPDDEVGQVARAFSDMSVEVGRLVGEMDAQRTHLANVLRSMQEMLFVCTKQGVIREVNYSACLALGLSECELVGRRFDDVFAPLRFDELWAGAQTQVVTAVPTQDVTLRSRNGAEVNLALSMSLLRDAARKPGGLVCVAQDLTERRRLEAELRQAQKLEAVGRLASGVAHEINNPIQFVSDSLHFIREATQHLTTHFKNNRARGESQRGGASIDFDFMLENLPQALDDAQEGIDRVVTIVRSIREYSHPGQKELAPVDLNAAVTAAVSMSRSEHKCVATVVTDLEPLPPVICRGGELHQVFLNLIVNAAHAIGDVVKGTSKMGRISIRTRARNGLVTISVSDTGAGIPTSIRDNVFDPFFTTKQVGRGTGQGLAIARAIVERHGGSLSFETVEGQGTTFHVRLPLHSNVRQESGPDLAAVA